MKIGIMTFHRACNPGAVLQAYALQMHLVKLGHDPFFIDYEWPPLTHNFLRRWIGATPGSTLWKWRRKSIESTYKRYREKHLRIGKPTYHIYAELANTPPQADLYLCGSDQIWNPLIVNKIGDERAYCLDFGDDRVRRISYAASFGMGELPSDFKMRLSRYLKRFSAISVRERDSVHILEKMGFNNASWVPDPTLLLNSYDYERAQEAVKVPPTDYIFWYQLQRSGEKLALAEEVLRLARDRIGAKALDVRACFRPDNILAWRFMSPGQWLAALERSRFVLTDSFHAVVFSVLFEKPFIVMERTGQSSGMNSRIHNLLNVLGLEGQILQVGKKAEAIERWSRGDLDWQTVKNRLEWFRQKGYEFLQRVLSSAK